MLRLCERVLRKACADFRVELRELNGEPDHAHLPVFHPPKVPSPALANGLKGVSGRRLRPQYTRQVNRAIMRGHVWSPSCLAASCGGAPLSTIRQYTQQQQRPA